MNRKSRLFIYSFFVLSAILSVEIWYLFWAKSMDEEALRSKREFVKTVQLPDLSISTEASYIRHRSLSDFFSAYRDDGTLREYFVSTYTYRSAPYLGDKQ
ncbi:hypothetical protein FCU45_06115 [Sulfurimonas crateris]|uniref:Uncharacterized protein n=1 Tax=Sulfurimonas crateris TaxID=2574727 RepID=A0A4U2Z808_9BACT|nr:hypothetical protein [Sulfurimonas crateris]TKI69630.1 hypothetical protein FCU45_06115 [Sulfurimonas crateris]